MDDSMLFGTLLFLAVALLVSYTPYRKRLKSDSGLVINTDVPGANYVLWLALIAFILDITAYFIVFLQTPSPSGSGPFLFYGCVYYALQFAFLPSALDRYANTSTRGLLLLCAVSKLIGYAWLFSGGDVPIGAIVTGAYAVGHVWLVDFVWYGFYMLPSDRYGTSRSFLASDDDF